MPVYIIGTLNKTLKPLLNNTKNIIQSKQVKILNGTRKKDFF